MKGKFQSYQELGMHQAEQRAFKNNEFPISRNSFRKGFMSGADSRQTEINGLLLVIDNMVKRERAYNRLEDMKYNPCRRAKRARNRGKR